MDKTTFREAQLLVIGAEAVKGRKSEYVALNNLQVFQIGDLVQVTEIRLDSPCVIIKVAEGPESYVPIDSLSEKVVDECIDILREVASNVDQYNEHL